MTREWRMLGMETRNEEENDDVLQEGRQKKSWKKDRPRIINVPLTQAEYDLIANASALSGKSKRETVRILITRNFSGFEAWAKNQSFYVDMLNELRKQGTNLNQIARIFNSGEKTMLSPADKKVIDQLNNNLIKVAEFLVDMLAMKEEK